MYLFFVITKKYCEGNKILDSVGYEPVPQKGKLAKIYSRPNVKQEHINKLTQVKDYIDKHNLDDDVLEQTEIQIKYKGYIEKEKSNADKLQRLENVKIPKGFDYSKLQSMSLEARGKLNDIQPVTVSQASRISGVSPADISVLLVYLGR